MKIIRLLMAASAAFFFASGAFAQNAGTVTNHAFALGKGAGHSGYTSLLCGSAQLAVGQSAADPICRTITGDVTITAAGVTAIGATKVTNAMLATMAANTTKCNATVGSAVPTDCTASTMRTNIGAVIGTNVQAWDADLDCIAAISTAGIVSRTGAGTCAVRSITAPAAGITVTNGDGVSGDPTLVLANDLAALEGLGGTGIARRTGTDTWSVGTSVSNSELSGQLPYTIKMNATGSTAVPANVEISTLTTKASPASGDYVILSDQAASGAIKKTTVSALASAGSVASLNGATGAVALSVTKQVFTSSGTYTPTTGMKYAIIECVGGGAGGGGVTGTAGSMFIAGGGASGGYSRTVVTAATVGASQTVSVGTAGGGGAAGSNNGSGGADTSVGTLCIAKAGLGGQYAATVQIPKGGVPGVAGTGDLAAAGNPGQPGFYSVITTVLGSGGNGASSIFGGAGLAATVANAAATAGVAAGAYGSGGSGANAINVTANAAGGSGSAGVVIITEYCIN